MADVRLIAIAVVVLGAGACGQAGAAPGSGITAPAGWQVMPDLAVAAKDALGKSVVVDGAEAWGEPAMGCYGVWLAVQAAGEAGAIAEQVVVGFAASELRIAVRDVVVPSGPEGVLALTFERAPYRGRLRARLGGERIVALACFANQREPIACEAACTSLLGALR
jgi:hypothetical protein